MQLRSAFQEFGPEIRGRGVARGALPWVCDPNYTPNPERVASRPRLVHTRDRRPSLCDLCPGGTCENSPTFERWAIVGPSLRDEDGQILAALDIPVRFGVD